MKAPRSHRSLIAALGGPPGLARKLGMKYEAVLPWNSRGIPLWRLSEIAEVARAHNVAVSVETLIADRKRVLPSRSGHSGAEAA